MTYGLKASSCDPLSIIHTQESRNCILFRRLKKNKKTKQKQKQKQKTKTNKKTNKKQFVFKNLVFHWLKMPYFFTKM